MIGNIKEITQSSTNKLEVLTYGYDSLDRLTSVLATDTLNTVYQRTYSYDEIGNIITVGKWPGAPANNNSASVGSASIAADNRGRITSFTGGDAYSAFTKGKLGPAPISNLTMGKGSVASGAISSNSSRGSVTSFTGGSGILPFTKGPNSYTAPPPQSWLYTTYNYSDSNHVHAVTSLTNGDTYQYDANGNMTTRVESGVTYTQTFNSENRLASVTVNNQTTQFVYDGDGNLVKKIKPDNTTIYIGSIYEKEYASSRSGEEKRGVELTKPLAGLCSFRATTHKRVGIRCSLSRAHQVVHEWRENWAKNVIDRKT